MSSDLATVEAVVSALYEARSHPAGGSPDWVRFRSLFEPHALLVQTGSNTGDYYVWAGVDDYICEHDQLRRGSEEFSQVEITRRTASFGGIAHVFNSYEQLFAGDRGPQTSRGVNSFHLARDQDGWRVVGWVWGEESEWHRIPADLLG